MLRTQLSAILGDERCPIRRMVSDSLQIIVPAQRANPNMPSREALSAVQVMPRGRTGYRRQGASNASPFSTGSFPSIIGSLVNRYGFGRPWYFSPNMERRFRRLTVESEAERNLNRHRAPMTLRQSQYEMEQVRT